MHKVRMTARPRYEENHITVKAEHQPVLVQDGTVLTGFRLTGKNGAGYDNAKCRTVVIPSSVDVIDNNAFSGWAALRHVCFDKRVCRLGSGVFSNCTSLETAAFAEGTEKIPLETFSGCSSLRKVTFPDTVTRINMDAFKNCRALEELLLPPALEVIEPAAFWGCRGLKTLRLPDTVTELGDNAFGSCTGLRQVSLSAGLKYIGSCAFHNCIHLEEITIPSGVKKLPAGVFAGCRNLRRVVLPETMESVSAYAFYQCEALEIVDHPNPGKFIHALRGTPFRNRQAPGPDQRKQLPMELLNMFAGEISGCVLCAMGYHWFDIDRDYRIFLTNHEGVIEVHSRYPDTAIPGGYGNDRWLMTEALEPIPGPQPLLRFSDEEIRNAGDLWHMQRSVAAYVVRWKKGD